MKKKVILGILSTEVAVVAGIAVKNYLDNKNFEFCCGCSDSAE